MVLKLFRSLVLVFAFSSSLSYAGNIGNNFPACTKNKSPIGINNKDVIAWKTTTPNQYHDRGYVVGEVVQAMQARDSHLHIEVNLDPSTNDLANHIEIVYNREFGAVPAFHKGSQAVVCGDYITSNAPSGRYDASPMGALIHWIHMSPNLQKHDNGYMMLDGVVTGQQDPGPRGGQNLISALWANPFASL